MHVTNSPTPGENFVDKAGRVRGVTRVLRIDDAVVVEYIEGDPELYLPTTPPRSLCGCDWAGCDDCHPETGRSERHA